MAIFTHPKNKIFYIFLVIVLSVLIVMSFLIIKNDINYRHQVYGIQPAPVNWWLYKYNITLDKFVKSFLNQDEVGLESVSIYVSEQNLRKLVDNPPLSTKVWQKGFLLHNGSLQKIKVKHKGDNPINYSFNSKSWRIKTKKTETINNIRVFDYSFPQNILPIQEYYPLHLARELSLLSPKVRLVELFINDVSSGVYIESEKLDESFLRNNKIMPVNLYKGERNNSDSLIGESDNLFNNPGSWVKQSVFNQKDDMDKQDIAYMLNTLVKSETDIDQFENFINSIDLDILARFSAYQILVQSLHNDSNHNMRLVLDPWSGNINVIPHDIGSFSNPFDILHDNGSNKLFTLLNKSSVFLDRKYYYLNKYLNNNILSKEANHIISLFDGINKSMSRSLQLWQITNSKITQSDLNLLRIKFVNKILNLEKELNNRISTKPDVYWRNQEKSLTLTIGSLIPVSNIEIKYQHNTPNGVYLDTNYNNVIDDNDMALPFNKNDNNTISLPITLFANRINQALNFLDFSGGNRTGKMVTPYTEFKLLMDCTCEPISLTGHNLYNNISYKYTKSNSVVGVVPTIHNIPIVHDKYSEKNIIKYTGNNVILEDVILDDPVVIEAGTKFIMYPKTSIVFRNKVIALGKSDNPIIFKPYDPKKPWGTVALQGKKTSGSILTNLTFTGGSGSEIQGIRYTSTLSLHNTNNVNLTSILLSNNLIYDDMIHIVYSNNINLKDISIKNSFSDAIDIDMSNNIKMYRIKIKDSGNDALDLMESNVLLDASEFKVAKDKAISVGERSNILVYNSLLSYSDIGIAIKDKSYAHIIHTDLFDNKHDISSFSKNWRYGGGGKVKVLRSRITTPYFQISPGSSMTILDSLVSSNIHDNQNITYIDVNKEHKVKHTEVDISEITDVAVVDMLNFIRPVRDPSFRGSDIYSD